MGGLNSDWVHQREEERRDLRERGRRETRPVLHFQNGLLATLEVSIHHNTEFSWRHA